MSGDLKFAIGFALFGLTCLGLSWWMLQKAKGHLRTALHLLGDDIEE